MAKREEFRRRVEAEHRPKYSPIRLVIFVIVVAACTGVSYLTFGSLLQASGGGSIDFGRITSFDQLAVNMYLRLRQSDVEARSSGSGDVPFQVQSGDTPATIGAKLQKLGLIQDSDLFRQVVKARGVESRLEAGDYVLRRGMNMDEILVSLQHGVVRPNTVRVIEGLRIEEIGAMLERQGVVSSANFVA